MKYFITNLHTTELRDSSDQILSFAHSEHFLGSVKIEFDVNGNRHLYNEDHVNIPLFIAEWLDFIDQLERFGRGEWLIRFTPFAYGVVRANQVVLSHSTGQNFSAHVFDISPLESIHKLKATLDRDAQKYGRIAITPRSDTPMI